jgi:hypothetical protein
LGKEEAPLSVEVNYYRREEIVIELGKVKALQTNTYVLSLTDAYNLYKGLERALADAKYPPE